MHTSNAELIMANRLMAAVLLVLVVLWLLSQPLYLGAGNFFVDRYVLDAVLDTVLIIQEALPIVPVNNVEKAFIAMDWDSLWISCQAKLNIFDFG